MKTISNFETSGWWIGKFYPQIPISTLKISMDFFSVSFDHCFTETNIALKGGGFNPFEKYESNWIISPKMIETHV